MRYYWPVYLLIRKYIYTEEDAENITQDTFEKALKWLQNKKFTPTPEKHISAWLYEIAKNKAIDFLKSAKNKPHQKIEPELEEMLPAPRPAPPHEPVLAKHIDEALATVTKLNRYIFIRRALDRKTYEEIGLELKPVLDKEAVRKRFNRTCDKLRPMLEFLRKEIE